MTFFKTGKKTRRERPSRPGLSLRALSGLGSQNKKISKEKNFSESADDEIFRYTQEGRGSKQLALAAGNEPGTLLGEKKKQQKYGP